MPNPSTPRAHTLVHLGVTFVLYFAAQWLALELGLAWGQAPGLWPVSAVGIAMILGVPDGRRAVAALVTALASLAAWVAIGWGDPLPIAVGVLVPLVVGWGGAELIARTVAPRPELDRSGPLLRVAGLVLVVISPVSALLWTLFGRVLAPGGGDVHFAQWFVPEFVMTLMLLPALWAALDWRRRLRETAVGERLLAASTLLIAVVAVSLVVSQPQASGIPLPISISIVPVLMVVAYRFGVGLTAWLGIVMGLTILAFSDAGIGPFALARPPGFQRHVAVLLYMGPLAVSFVLLAAVLSDLRASSQRFHAILGSTDEPIVVVDVDRRIVGFSAAADRIFRRLGGKPLYIGGDPLAVYASAPDVASRRAEGWRRALAGESVRIQAQSADGNRLELQYDPMRDAAGRIVGATSSAVDLAAREREERERLRAGRLGAIGRLAGGVAHDINNLMTVIFGQTFFLREQLPVTPDAADAIEEIEATVERTKRLTTQLLTFARAQAIAPRVIILPAQVDRTVGLVRRVVEETIHLEVDHRGDAWATRIDESQFEQILLNLAANARDAMPEGGTLRIRTEPVTLSSAEAEPLGLAPAEYVQLTVTDTGLGMPAEILANVFDPFFSTKGNKGTGLGLATVQAIVRQANGAITASSVPHQGSEFRLYFPRTLEPAEPEGAAPPPQPLPGQAHIVVCDDNASIRRAITRMLDAVGHHVTEAATASDALAVIAAERGRVDLLITDVVMPGMGGVDLVREAKRLHPELRALLISGYADADALTPVAAPFDGDVLLAKPFRGEQLLQRVEAMLGRVPVG